MHTRQSNNLSLLDTNLSRDSSLMSDGCQVTKVIFWAKRMTCCPVPEPSSKANSCLWDWSSNTSSSTEHSPSQFLSACGDSSMVWGREIEKICHPFILSCLLSIVFFSLTGCLLPSRVLVERHWRVNGILLEDGHGGWLQQQMGAEITWLRGFHMCYSPVSNTGKKQVVQSTSRNR